MSYCKEIEYKIVPCQSFSVIRNCSGCGAKVPFINTKKFRVNANGNKLDVWLIYQCTKCKHTYNLPIYRGQKANLIPKDEYQRFWNNDEELAMEYGKNFQFFKKNKAEVDLGNIDYQFIKQKEINRSSIDNQQSMITIHNPYELKIRIEKQIAKVLGLSRNQIKRQMESEQIKTESKSSQMVMIYVNEIGSHIIEA